MVQVVRHGYRLWWSPEAFSFNNASMMAHVDKRLQLLNLLP